jgi:hypothetical protein
MIIYVAGANRRVGGQKSPCQEVNEQASGDAGRKRMARGLQRACAFLYMCGDGGGWEIFLPGCLTRLVSSSMIASR